MGRGTRREIEVGSDYGKDSYPEYPLGDKSTEKGVEGGVPLTDNRWDDRRRDLIVSLRCSVLFSGNVSFESGTFITSRRVPSTLSFFSTSIFFFF